MFAKVIPLTKLPRKLEYFDYSVPHEFEEKIKKGHIVAIYFRGQKIYGIAEQLSDETKVLPEKIKSIAEITDIILPENYIKLIHWAGERYLASPALFYKFFIPRKTAMRGAPAVPPSKELIINKTQAGNVIGSLENFKDIGNDFFLYENDSKEIIATFIKLAQKEFQNKKQVLILTPAI